MYCYWHGYHVNCLIFRHRECVLYPMSVTMVTALFSDTEDVCIVERLFSSSLVAIVSLSSPRKLKVCHFKKGTEICNYSYSNTILAVRLNRLVSRENHSAVIGCFANIH